MAKEKKPEWEEVQADTLRRTARLRITGGWLYHTIAQMDYEHPWMPSMVFVPDPPMYDLAKAPTK